MELIYLESLGHSFDILRDVTSQIRFIYPSFVFKLKYI